MIKLKSFSFFLIFIFNFSILTSAQNITGFSASVGANFTNFKSFIFENSNQPQLGHSVSLDGRYGEKWQFAPGITLRHYKNSVGLMGSENLSTKMSVDLLNFHLSGEGIIASFGKFELGIFTGFGMDYNFKIKSSMLPIIEDDYNKTVFTGFAGFKLYLSKFFLATSFENAFNSFLKNGGTNSRLFEFKLGYKVL